MIFNSKKGTEKPIEIFVALFIILAVSMIMLKMFQGQISEKTTELKDMQRETDLKDRLDGARLICRDLCSEAATDGCTKRSVSAYCMRRLGSLDLDGDLETGGYDTTLLGGVGACEDAIYCPMLTECKCGKTLSMTICKDILCEYWETMGVTPDTARTAMLTDGYQEGGCSTETDYDPTRMWNTILFPTGTNPLTCPP